MKKIRAWRTFEILEQKRLKAADLAACPDAHGPAFVEAADETPVSESIEYQVQSGHLEQPQMLFDSSETDESDDEQESESENESDDSEEDETDETDEEDESDDESDDDESDTDDSDEGDDDSSDENDTEEDDTEEDDDDEEESDDDESDSDDSDEGDDDSSDENDTEEDDSDEDDDDESSDDDSDESDDDESEDDDSDESDTPEVSAPIRMSADTQGSDHAEAPTQSLAASAALSPESGVIAGSVSGLSVSPANGASSSSGAGIATTTAASVDRNLLDAVYSAPDKQDELENEAAPLERDGAEQVVTTDAAFGTVATNWPVWTL